MPIDIFYGQVYSASDPGPKVQEFVKAYGWPIILIISAVLLA